LVSNNEQIHKVTDAVGWQYKFDERQGQFAHPSAVTLLTPSGKVARYLYGIEFDPNDLRLGLLEASEGRSITTVDRLILFCYHYDPQDRKYTLMATRVMQLGGVVTMFTLGGFLALMWVRERKKSRNDNNGPKRPDDKNDSKKDGVPKNPLPQGSHARA
jgi:protein SCO1/2